MQEVGKFDGEVSAIPNGLKNTWLLQLKINCCFFDSMQFMNSSLDALVKNLSDNNFKYLSEEFSGDLLELVKQKDLHPFKYIDSFKKFSEYKLPDRCNFF